MKCSLLLSLLLACSSGADDDSSSKKQARRPGPSAQNSKTTNIEAPEPAEVDATLFTEAMTVVTSDRNQTHFQIKARIVLRSKTPRDMRAFAGNWYANNVRDQVMSAVRLQTTPLTSAELTVSLKEIESEVLTALLERFANTPVIFESFELTLISKND